jgi:hypothetical protein
MELTLRCCNCAQAVRAHLLLLWRPQSSGTVVQGCPLGPKLLSAWPIKMLEGLGPVAHGAVGGGHGGKVRSTAFGRAGVG